MLIAALKALCDKVPEPSNAGVSSFSLLKAVKSRSEHMRED